MNDPFEAATIHRQELDREIETIRTERLLESAASPADSARQGLTERARTGLAHRLISLGVALLPSDGAHRSAAATGDGGAWH